MMNVAITHNDCMVMYSVQGIYVVNGIRTECMKAVNDGTWREYDS